MQSNKVLAQWQQDDDTTVSVEAHGDKLHIVEHYGYNGQRLQAVIELEDALTLAKAIEEFCAATAPAADPFDYWNDPNYVRHLEARAEAELDARCDRVSSGFGWD